jgi:hypothetical protein
MRLPTYQRRVLEWFADPTRSHKAAEIGGALGYTAGTVRMARSVLVNMGLLRTVVEVTPAGQALLPKE